MDLNDLMLIEEVAEQSRTPVATLRYMRVRGEGPPAFKVGRRLLYRRADVQAWLEAARTQQVKAAK